MPKCHCTLCGREFCVGLHEVWVCDVCEIGAADYPVVAYEPDELKGLYKIFQKAKNAIDNYKISTKGSVFPAFVHEAELTEPLLDLLVMFFDKILLYIDTFNIYGDKKKILDKLNAYIESGYILIFGWDNRLITNIALKEPHIAMDNMAPYAKGLYAFHPYVQKYSQIQTYIDRTCLPPAPLKEAMKKLPFHQRIKDEDERLSHMFWWNVHGHVLNRLNGFSMLCDILGCNILTDSHLSMFKKLKYKADFDQIAKERNIMLNLIEWYAEKIKEYPKFEKPETLIKFRNGVGKESFVNFIINQYTRISKETYIPNHQIVEEIKKEIDNKIAKAKLICGRSYQTKKHILSSLIATLGSLIGGTTGAFTAGIGATLGPLGIEYFDKKNVEHWASFFIE